MLYRTRAAKIKVSERFHFLELNCVNFQIKFYERSLLVFEYVLNAQFVISNSLILHDKFS